MTYRIAIAAIVGLIGFSVLAPAEASKRRPEPPQASATTTLGVDEAFVAAQQAFTKNDPARFEAMAAQARGHPLAVYLGYWRLRLRLQQPAREVPPGAADAAVQRFLALHEGTLVADLLSRDWMLDLGRRHEWPAFDAEYTRWILRDDDEVHCYASLGNVERGQPAPRARAALFSVRNFAPGCTALLDAQLRTGALGRDDLHARLLLALETNAPDAVRVLGERLALDTGVVDLALSNPSKALAGKRTRETMLIALSRLARKDPSEASERLEAIAPALQAADVAFARSQIAAAAMRRLDPRALEWTRASLDAPATDETWNWLARAALREHDWATLRKVVARMSEAGRSEPAWVYWSARVEREAGNAAKADEMLRPIADQFTFYGRLAAEDLGSLTSPPPAALATTEDELAQAARNAGFDRALRFYALGLRFEGNREWNFQLRGMNDRQLLATAEWACRQSILDRCVNTADRTRDQHDFQLRFVTPFLEQLQPVALSRELDPAWVYGLIRQESRFIGVARSSAGASGLMQVMPATAKWIAKRLGMTDYRPGMITELDTNMKFGTHYMRYTLDRMGGQALMATAAYNAGPSRPKRWAGPEALEGPIYADTIPFTETRDYVKKVMANAFYYAQQMGHRNLPLTERLGTVPANGGTAAVEENKND